MEIREITLVERPCALELVFHTFMQYEAPDYSNEGVESFRNSVIDNNDFLDHIVLYGAFSGDEIRGVIATRNQGNHIALFFVDGKYHNQGIGKALFQTVLQKCKSNEMTVHSSPYAVPIYQHLGFVESAPEQITDGIRYTPMIYKMELNKGKRIGQGNTAEIFKLDNDKILKLFRSGLDKRIIEREYQNGSFIQTVLDCVPKVYEMVEVDGRYGIIYQEIQGTDMLKCMLTSIWKINTYARNLAHYHLNIQRPIEGHLYTVKEKLEEDLNSVEILSKKQKESIKEYLSKLPDGNELCHFDFHPGNIMLIKETAFLIDWMTACRGDSLADVARTCIMLKYGEVAHAPWLMRKMISIFQHHIYKVYIKEYLLISGKKMEDIKRWELPIAAARLREWIPENEKQVLLQLIEKECTSMKM